MTVLTIVGLRRHFAHGLPVNAAAHQLIDIGKEHLNAVGIDSAKVSSNQRTGDQLRHLYGDSVPDEKR